MLVLLISAGHHPTLEAQAQVEATSQLRTASVPSLGDLVSPQIKVSRKIEDRSEDVIRIEVCVAITVWPPLPQFMRASTRPP